LPRLRVCDASLERNEIMIKNAKGNSTVISQSCLRPLGNMIIRSRENFYIDTKDDTTQFELASALNRKFPNAGSSSRGGLYSRPLRHRETRVLETLGVIIFILETFLERFLKPPKKQVSISM
jgi:hypothetical protein